MNPGVVDLSKYQNPPDLDKGKPFLIRACWHFVNAVFLQNPLNPSSTVKRWCLQIFGAKIGKGCVLKPGLNVKSPWFLTIGDYCFIGERVWIDSLAPVRIGNNVCLSQDVYLCCGNHDWTDPHFGKTVKPIAIEDGAWLATRSTVLFGVTVATQSVVCAGSVLSKNTEPNGIYSGVPATKIKERQIRVATDT